MIGEKFNLLSDSRVELSSILKTSLYSKKKDKESYLLRTHEKFKGLNDTQKLNFTKNGDVAEGIFSESENESDHEIS